jgi:SAM-dependent methyltransferase
MVDKLGGQDGGQIMRDYSRFDRFLNKCASEVYPELPAEPHLTITRWIILGLYSDGLIGRGQRVLDVGCGQGIALDMFQQLGLRAVGITLGPDVAACRAHGFEVHEMDQNFIEFDDEEFDLLWCRHVLEHSIAPAFTLSEYRRVTRLSGLVYIEMPAPDTAAQHQHSPNHYSVLPSSAWFSLILGAGFTVLRSVAINFIAPCGPDTYWSYLLRRDE